MEDLLSSVKFVKVLQAISSTTSRSSLETMNIKAKSTEDPQMSKMSRAGAG
jgi:hypothetical protein